MAASSSKPPPRTPIKTIKKPGFTCFVCLRTDEVMTYGIHGKKCERESFVAKVNDLLGDKKLGLLANLLEQCTAAHECTAAHGTLFTITSSSSCVAQVCRMCYTRIVNAHDVQSTLYSGVCKFTSASTGERTKRMALFSPSPLKTLAAGSIAIPVPPPAPDLPAGAAKRKKRGLILGQTPMRPSNVPRKLILSINDEVHPTRPTPADTPLALYTWPPAPSLRPSQSASPASAIMDISTSQDYELPRPTPDTVEHSYAASDRSQVQKDATAKKKREADDILKHSGLNRNKEFSLDAINECDSSNFVDVLESLSASDGNVVPYMHAVMSNQKMMTIVHRIVLLQLDRQCTDLLSRNVVLQSVLRKKHQIGDLNRDADHLIFDIIREMHNRIPFLLDIMVTLIGGKKEVTVDHLGGPLASVYGILMSERNPMLSAWKRLMTVVGIRAHMEATGMTRFNHMGITQSTTSKIRILDEASKETDKKIVEALQENPLVKLTGDNLDIRVKTSRQTTESHHKDLHYFVTNMIFSRVATPDLSTVPECVDPATVIPSTLLLHGDHEKRLKHCFMVILARILSDIQAFSWMKSVIPNHIEHQHAAKMSKKSKVFPLPILFKNEQGHSDCMDILDGYEELLIKYYTEATGSADVLHKFKVPVGGDQLTRQRFQEVKELRKLSPNAVKRYDDLEPIIIELWHLKQDLLEKCYKLLFKKASLRQSGTLYFFKSRLMRTDANGNVKSSMKAHHQLLMDVGRELIREQAFEYFGLETDESEPTLHKPPDDVTNLDATQKYSVMESMILEYIDYFGYGDFSLSDFVAKPIDPVPDASVETLGVTEDGHMLFKLVAGTPQKPDRLFNYSVNMCHWVLQLMELDDTAHEGDFTRTVPNLMHSMPFFYSHSRLSKYFIECMKYIIQVERMLSPLQRLRVLEGSFVNVHGGIGKNVEADLKQEQSVRNQKDAIRQLGANKSEKTILRATRAADTINSITESLDSSINVRKVSGQHSKAKTEKDTKFIRKELREQRPFRFTPGRECAGFDNITRSTFERVNIDDMRARMEHIIRRLLGGEMPNIPEEDSELLMMCEVVFACGTN